MTSKISRSPQRGTFGIDMLKEKLKSGETTQEHVDDMTTYYKKMIDDKLVTESTPEWSENNLEFDLRTSDWILQKVRKSEVYSQNLYAALCNNEFVKISIENTPENVAKLLRDDFKRWSCSWRYAGGIIADMREEGDYIDWYCSGIRNSYDTSDNAIENAKFSEHKYVSESVVTEEISNDLNQLGWRVILDKEENVY